MKNKLFSLFSIAVVVLTGGCKITNPYGRVTPTATTNLVGTVIHQQVGNQPPVKFAQTNFSVTHTSRPVVPPAPNAAITGVNPVVIGGQSPPSQQPPPQQQSAPRVNRGVAPSGARVLRPNRQRSPILYPNRERSGGTFSSVGNGLRDFFLPTLYTQTRASLTAVYGASGRVKVPVTRFERKALGHAAQVGAPVRRGRYYGTRVKSTQVRLAVAGAGRYRSGLP